jgi:hypothetical protein
LSSRHRSASRGDADDEVEPRERLGPWRWLPAPAVFDINDPAHYVHWHFFQMSVANVVVILLMIAVFVAAILLPFPRRARE